MFGSHLSTAGGLHQALLHAKALRMDCVQVFTRNQRQWRAKELTSEELELWRDAQRRTRVAPAVSHDSYLINLASPDDALWGRSVAAFRDEMLRCEALGIELLVAHPGAHTGAGLEFGLQRVASALNRLHRELPGLRVVTCLEITAGQGSGVGWRFEQLRRIIDEVDQPERLAVCIDTAHLLAAGYDLTSADGARSTLQEADDVLGPGRIRVVHCNDSKIPLASRVDRHGHIGHGCVSLEAFRVLVDHPPLRTVPKILETPKETAPDGREWDAINLAVLRRLVGRRRARPTA